MATTVEKLAETLQDAEIVVLKTLAKSPHNSEDLAKKSLLGQSAVSRACLWLQNKGLIETKETPQVFVALEKLGRQYADDGLPERKFLLAIKDSPKYLDEIAAAAKLNKQEAQFSLGHWKKHNTISFENGKVKLVSPQILAQKTSEEVLLAHLKEDREIELKKLKTEEEFVFGELKKRGIIKKVEKTIREFTITDLGKKVSSAVKSEQRIGLLTPAIVKSGSWKNSAFRRYDVEAPVPKIWPGKKQAYKAFLDEVKEELVAMGFEEMAGPLVELSFFNNDALYMPQDHPARGIHDIYYVREPKYGSLAGCKKILAEVKKAHESGGKTGSTGWQTQFDEKESARLILRTQGTALSARTLANPNVKIPGAYFAVARCYRPDVLDATHLVEFNQCEGIVLGEKLNFRNLLGLLAEFTKKMTNSDRIRFRSHYFPFTEPSIEADVFDSEKNKWMEVFGAGILRPEVTIPLGVKVPVLAWGIGIDRFFMLRNKISDIRQLFSQDIQWLREAKI